MLCFPWLQYWAARGGAAPRTVFGKSTWIDDHQRSPIANQARQAGRQADKQAGRQAGQAAHRPTPQWHSAHSKNKRASFFGLPFARTSPQSCSLVWFPWSLELRVPPRSKLQAPTTPTTTTLPTPLTRRQTVDGITDVRFSILAKICSPGHSAAAMIPGCRTQQS